MAWVADCRGGPHLFLHPVGMPRGSRGVSHGGGVGSGGTLACRTVSPRLNFLMQGFLLSMIGEVPVGMLWACCGGWLLFVWGMNLATPGAADDVPLRRAGCHGALQATWGCRWVYWVEPW